MRYELRDASGKIVHIDEHSTPANTMIWVDRGRRREFKAEAVIYPPDYNEDTGQGRDRILIVYQEVGEPQEDPR